MLVTDGEQRSALATVRALGRAGHRVFVCSARKHSLAAASRYAAASLQVPDPLREPSQFVDALADAIARWRIDTLMPMTDASMLAILAERARVAPAALPFADLDAYQGVSDKQALLAIAPCVGIAVPAQHTLCAENAATIAEGHLGHRDIRFPVVVKPARSIGEHDGRRARYGVRYAGNLEELAEIVRTTEPAAFPLLLQQRVVGPGVGIFLLVWDGETVATFSHRRLREKPPSGGVSVYRESIAADPDLVARSRALLDHFGWRGVAMIEYKIDAATGTPYLMEINGRFWGSLQLAVDAGVDFPNLLLATGVDGAPTRAAGYRVGVRSRWWWGDVDQLLARLRRSPAALALPPDSPTRRQAVREFFRFWNKQDRNEILRLDDPWPFVRESIDWFRAR